MSSDIMHEIIEMMESEAHSRPSPMEYEMAYQARVAMDRIRFAIKHGNEFSQPSEQMREACLQLLEALERLEYLDRVSKSGHESRLACAGPTAQTQTTSMGREGDQPVDRRMEGERECLNSEPTRGTTRTNYRARLRPFRDAGPTRLVPLSGREEPNGADHNH